MQTSSPPTVPSSSDDPLSGQPVDRSQSLSVFTPQLLAFISSMAIMVLELVAGRLVANSVGSSQYTWISTLCVILAGMSIGNHVGGRWADRMVSSRLLPRLFLGAGCSIALTLPLTAALAHLRTLALPLVMAYPRGASHFWGMAVLALMMAAFLAPATVLGALSPAIARLALLRGRSPARAIGDVYSWGAIGAILGIVLTGFVFLARVDVRTIVLSMAAVMGALSLFSLGLERRIPLQTSASIERDPKSGSVQGPSESQAGEPTIPSWIPLALIAVSSACLMMIETVAGRLTSRALGSSLYSWTGVIGVIFAGMSLGNHLGGKLAARWYRNSESPERSADDRLQHASEVHLHTGRIHLRGVSRLFILASLTTFLALWTHSWIESAARPEAWGVREWRLDGTFSFPDRAMLALQEQGLAPEIASSLARVNEERLSSEEALREHLEEILPGELLPAQLETIVAHAVLAGPQIERLRTEGVSEAAINTLRPRINRTFLRGFREAVIKGLYDSPLVMAEGDGPRSRYEDRIAEAALVPTLFRYPVRLLIVVTLVFFWPALVLGMISPVLAAMALEPGRTQGRSLGRAYAWGAWGSIVGTLVSGFYLIAAVGTIPLLAGAATVLALLAVGLEPRSPLGWGVSALLLGLGMPAYYQATLPDAFDPAPGEALVVTPAPAPLEDTVNAWNRLVNTADPDRNHNTGESQYQFLRVAGGRSRTGPRDLEVRRLQLDRLVHGYVALEIDRENRRTPNFTELEYHYERLYALATARLIMSEFGFNRTQDGRLRVETVPPITALFLGGGAYTFPRYVLDRYAGMEQVVLPGDTLLRLVARTYRSQSEPAQRALALRLGRILTQRGVLRDAASDPDAVLDPGQRLVLPSIADVAELDPEVVTINQTRLFLPSEEVDARIQTWTYDARNVVEAMRDAGWTRHYDVIYGDAFNHYSPPYHLTTLEFNQAIQSLLRPGGAFIANLIDQYERPQLLSAYLTTLKQLYRHVDVLAERSMERRHGRETFVLVASDSRLELSALASLDGWMLDALEAGLDEPLRESLEEGRDELWQEILRVREDFGTEFLSRMELLRRVDAFALGLPQDEQALREVEDRFPERLEARRSTALPADLIASEIVESGLPIGLLTALRAAPPLQTLLGPPLHRFQVTDTSQARLLALGAPPPVLDALDRLRDRTFDSAETLLDTLSREVSPSLVLPLQHHILVATRDRFDQHAPLILRDRFAPVEELVAPLFERR